MTWVLVAAIVLLVLAAVLLAWGLCGTSSNADELAGRSEGERLRRASR